MAPFSTGSRGPDLEGLTKFVRTGDRDDARFFVGRTGVIEHIGDVCGSVRESAGAGRGPKGATQLLRGAPGAGKTAILSELTRLWEAGGKEKPATVMLEPADLGDPASVATLIAEAVWPGASSDWRTQRSWSVGGAVGVGGTGADGRTEGSVYPEDAHLNTLKRMRPGRTWPRPVCLMVDEIQTVGPEAGPMLLALHTAWHGLPVVPVYAGLGDSHDTLRAAGLTRLESEAVHEIDALGGGEAASAVERMLEEFRVPTGDARVNWPSLIANVSDGWPQHLHNGMRALAKGLLECGGALADVDAARVRQREREFRAASYSRRRSDEIRRARFLVAELMRQLPEKGSEDSTIVRQIRSLARPLDEPEGDGWSLPKGRDEEWFLKHLVHQGVLQFNGNDLYSCPIPSFRSYLMEKGGLAPPLPELTGDEPPSRSRGRGLGAELT